MCMFYLLLFAKSAGTASFPSLFLPIQISPPLVLDNHYTSSRDRLHRIVLSVGGKEGRWLMAVNYDVCGMVEEFSGTSAEIVMWQTEDLHNYDSQEDRSAPVPRISLPSVSNLLLGDQTPLVLPSLSPSRRVDISRLPPFSSLTNEPSAGLVGTPPHPFFEPRTPQSSPFTMASSEHPHDPFTGSSMIFPFFCTNSSSSQSPTLSSLSSPPTSISSLPLSPQVFEPTTKRPPKSKRKRKSSSSPTRSRKHQKNAENEMESRNLSAKESSSKSSISSGYSEDRQITVKISEMRGRIPSYLRTGFACLACGTKKTSQWRRGPTGTTTLCNACGLSFARTQELPPPGRTKKVRKQPAVPKKKLSRP
ncbi:GATA type zinc finger transcription factor family protein [Balamuthia mandrillaris]